MKFPKFNYPSWPFKPKKLFGFEKPDEREYKKYIGKQVLIPRAGDEPLRVTIETIVGHRFKPAFYEINGQHLIGMLRFHAQMNKDNSITEEEFKQFEEIQFEVEMMPKKTALHLPPSYK